MLSLNGNLINPHSKIMIYKSLITFRIFQTWALYQTRQTVHETLLLLQVCFHHIYSHCQVLWQFITFSKNHVHYHISLNNTSESQNGLVKSLALCNKTNLLSLRHLPHLNHKVLLYNTLPLTNWFAWQTAKQHLYF